MASRDSEEGRFLRVLAWIILSILLAVMSAWLVPEGYLHLTVAGAAVVISLVATVNMPWIFVWMRPEGYMFFAGVSMVVSLITGALIFGWWGIAFMVFTLISYLMSASIAAR